MSKTIFITTSIPFVNSHPHVGHAQEFVLADCIARLHRSLGREVILQTGTDENAFKNVLAAERAGVSTHDFVDRNAAVFRHLVTRLNLSAHTFVRTTDPRHARAVEVFWSRLRAEDLYEHSYQGLYCVGCEDFFHERDLVEGLCPDHQARPEPIAERNIFFRLSRYQEKLEKLIESDTIRIVPEVRKNEVLSFIRQGLQDISLTRAKSRSGGWGIPAPGFADQVVYVWIDALINYLSGQGFGSDDAWERVWNSDTKKIHVIGKNVWKFHAVYWPALLLSAGLPLPNEIVVHGFLTSNGTKISKSLGNSIDPIELIERHGTDPVRHVLLTCTPIFVDADFSEERVAKRYETDFANRLGNLHSRLLALAEKAQWSFRPSEAPLPTERIQAALDRYAPQDLALEAWRIVDRLNAEINERRPWEHLKRDDRAELHALLQCWFEAFAAAAALLWPFVPESSDRVRQGLAREQGNERILFPLKK